MTAPNGKDEPRARWGDRREDYVASMETRYAAGYREA